VSEGPQFNSPYALPSGKPPVGCKVANSEVSLILHTMNKRTISKKVSGTTNGRDWYMLVFAAALIGATLHTDKTVFVSKDIYEAVKEGLTLNVE
jgi:hypothetical protein